MLSNLRPYKLDWIQFRSASWEPIFVQTRMVFNEFLRLRRDMNFVIIPDENNVIRRQSQNLFQQKDSVLGSQVALKGARAQTEFSKFWADKQSAQ